MTDDPTTTSPETLRGAMVDRIAAGRALSARVADAMRTVPRHRFVPAAPIGEAYGDQAVIIKRGSDGAALSCASVPSIVALMLDQLDVRAGDRVLEIGAGTGYNAALLAHLTGPDGEVTTVDIDPEITGHARHALDAVGFGHVRAVTRDGALGDADRAPFDRIIVTVGAWDVAPEWCEQLAPGGRLVVPLRWRGQTRTVALLHHDGGLRSDSVELCGFVPMIGQEGERTGHIDSDGQVALAWDADQPIEPTALRSTLDQPRNEAWSGVFVGAEEPFDGVWLRLTAVEPRTCRISAERGAVAAGRCSPAIPVRSPALVDGESLAYLTLRRSEEEGVNPRFELGAVGHGPNGQSLATRICELVDVWGYDRTARPILVVRRANVADELAIQKRHIRLEVRF